MEPNPKRLKALHGPFGVRRPSTFACRPLESPCPNLLNNAPESANPGRELVQPALSRRLDFDTRADIRGEFSDAIAIVETAYTALETFETATFALACLRFGIDKLNNAYCKIESASMPNVSTVSDIEPSTENADPAPTRRVPRGVHKKGRRTRERSSAKSRKRVQ